MDILNQVLKTLDLKGTLYFRTEFNGHWAVSVPAYQHACRFHLVQQGNCHVRLQDGDNIALQTGDLVMVTHGRAHMLSDVPRSSAPPLEKVLEQSGYQGDGVLVLGEGNQTAQTRLLCGHYNFRPGASHPLLKALPDCIIISAKQRAQAPLLDETLQLLNRRAFSGKLGSDAAVIRLSEIVLLEVLQSGLAGSSRLSKVMDAFADPQIASAITLMHSQPDHPWTLSALAGEVAMSRARFAARFKQLLGLTPMSYLAEWRLQIALHLLGDSNNSVQQVANGAGYQSHAGFSRAFQEKFGINPRQYRAEPQLLRINTEARRYATGK
jgi:AraC-like DNA-binding protein